MSRPFEVIVVGLGAMGSAACFHLASRGTAVLGIDRFTPPHDRGSSHGRTRIIREAYFEHPIYVPLVQRAYTLWFELQSRWGKPLLHTTGGLMIGSPSSAVVAGSKRSAEQHRLPHEVLSPEQLRARFPMFHPGPEMSAVWEPRAGFLYPERCVEAHLSLARRSGAEVHTGEQVLSWQPDGTGIRVQTGAGEYVADKLLLTAGPWLPQLLPDLKIPLQVERQVLFWFTPLEPELFQPEKCPIHLWEYEPGRFFYGFPDIGDGVKVAFHHQGEATSPDTARREIAPDEIDTMRKLLERFLPAAAGPFRDATVCLYTNTPDEHFLIDKHPAHPQVLIASPCSGHGFKFSSAVGELAADLLAGKTPSIDLSLFSFRW